MIDLYFYARNVVRFALIHKTEIINSYDIPFTERVDISFIIKELTDINDASIYNYNFLSIFFFGKRIFFLKFEENFLLNKYYFKFIIRICLKEREFFSNLLFLLNDVIPLLGQEHIYYSKISKNYNNFRFEILDMNIFLDKKNNIGLFFLKFPLSISIFILHSNFLRIKMIKNLFSIN